ncbi:MAG: hypothetical protein JXQ76_03710 [Campylobacterales bacterium]|nr:hypothetical protein [Campylobacterales bacterium]
MTQTQMHELFKVDTRTLRNWKNGNRQELYRLLESLDYESAQKLLAQNDKNSYIRVLENQDYFSSLMDFERELYPLLTHRDTTLWKKLAFDTALSKEARLRSAYLYSYLTHKSLKLRFRLDRYRGKVSFYHNNRVEDGDGFARLYGLKNGLDDRRFNLYKTTGTF